MTPASTQQPTAGPPPPGRPPTHSRQSSLGGHLPSIHEDGHGSEALSPPVPHIITSISNRKRSLGRANMESTSSEMLSAGSGGPQSVTEDLTSSPPSSATPLGIPPTAPRPSLSNRIPRPPSIMLYPTPGLQYSHIVPSKEAQSAHSHVSPRPSSHASEDGEQCSSVVYHPSSQSVLPVWATSPSETPTSGSATTKVSAPFHSNLPWCASPSGVPVLYPHTPSASSALETVTGSVTPGSVPSPQPPVAAAGPNTADGNNSYCRPRSLDSGVKAAASSQPSTIRTARPDSLDGASKRRIQGPLVGPGGIQWQNHPEQGTLHSSSATCEESKKVHHRPSDSCTQIMLAPPPILGTPSRAATAHESVVPPDDDGACSQSTAAPAPAPAPAAANRGAMAAPQPPASTAAAQPAAAAEAAIIERSAGEGQQPRAVGGADNGGNPDAFAHVLMAHNPLSQQGGTGPLPFEESEPESVDDVLSGRVTVLVEDEGAEAAAAAEQDKLSEMEGTGDFVEDYEGAAVVEEEAVRATAAAEEQAAAEEAADRAVLSAGCGFGVVFGVGMRASVPSFGQHASVGDTIYSVANNSLYAHANVGVEVHSTGVTLGPQVSHDPAGGVQSRQGAAHNEPPIVMPAAKTWHNTVDVLWDRLSLALFLLALILDIVFIVSFAAGACNAAWWVPTIVFIAAHTCFMGLVLLAHSQWSARCWQSFKDMFNGPECSGLRQSWCRQSPLRFLLLPPQALVIVITLFVGSIVSLFVLVAVVVVAIASVPLVDLSTVAATIWPAEDKKRFRSQDLLFLENFKLARYSLQAVLQSLPQIILLAIALSSIGPLNGNSSKTKQCDAPEGVVIAALVVASLNVLDKLFQSGLQAKRMVGRHGLSGVMGLGRNMVDLVTIQGSHRVPFPVMDITLAQMLRSASDFVVGAEYISEPRRSPTPQAPPPQEVVVVPSQQGHPAPTANPVSLHIPGPPGENSPQRRGSPHQGLQPLVTPSTPPHSTTPVPTSTTPRSPAGQGLRHFQRLGGGTSGGSPSRQRVSHWSRVRNGPDLIRFIQGRGNELTEVRAVTPISEPEERGLPITVSHFLSRDQPPDSVPLVPSLLLPSHGGRLEAGQMATVVREAIARYPHHTITRWAMESFMGADQGLADIMAGGLRRFIALQNLTICKCKIGGRDFLKVAKLLIAHDQLTDLRFEHVAMDKIATGALADLVRNATRIMRLDLAHCTFPKNHPQAVSGIAKALVYNTTLATLTFAGNDLDVSGIHALTEGLSKNHSLRLLDLSSNPQLSNPACVSALVNLLYIVGLRQHDGAQADGPDSLPPLRLVLTIKDLGFAGAHQLVTELGARQEQALHQHGKQMPPCTIVSHGPLPPSCLQVSGLPLWLVAGGAEGSAAIEALMPSAPPPPNTHPGGMSPIRESPSSPPITPDQALPLPRLSREAAQDPSQGQPTHAPHKSTTEGSSELPTHTHAPQTSSPQGSSASPVPSVNGAVAYQGSGDVNDSSSATTNPLAVGACELVFVCGGVDNLSLVGVLCSCHRILGEFLSSLDLSGLSICDRGGRLMADLVLHTPKLQSLSLSGCNITDEGAEPLLEALTERYSSCSTSPNLHVDMSRNTLGDGAAIKLIKLAKVTARARHTAAIQTVVAVARHCGCYPNAATAAAEAAVTGAASGLGAGAGAEVAAAQELQQRMRQQLRITLLDNMYPMSMDALRGLQRALTKCSAPLNASSIAAEATVHLQQQQDARQEHQQQHEEQGGSSGSGLESERQWLQDNRNNSSSNAEGDSSAFGSRTREEVVAVTLRIANALLGRQAGCPASFVLELVHRPGGLLATQGPTQAGRASSGPRVSGRLPSGNQIPTALVRRASGQGSVTLPPIPSAASLCTLGDTPTDTAHDPHDEDLLAFKGTQWPGRAEGEAAGAETQPPPRHHRRNASADASCWQPPLRPTPTPHIDCERARHFRNPSASHAESHVIHLRSPFAASHTHKPPAQASQTGHSQESHAHTRETHHGHRRDPLVSDTHSATHRSVPSTSDSNPFNTRHTRNVSVTDSQIEATAAVISGAMDDGNGGLTGLTLVGLGPTPSHSRNVSGSMPALSRGHTRTLSTAFTEGSDGENGCGVCFDNPSNLLLRGCGHKICVQCYRQLVQPGAAPTARCPFCRSLITGFDYRLGSDQALLWH